MRSGRRLRHHRRGVLINLIEARKLTKLFPGGVAAVNSINLVISRGEHIAISGASGSGKSTLLSLLAALDIASSGDVIFDGVSLNSLPESARARLRREKIGFVFQAFHLVPSLTVLENVCLPLALGTHVIDENAGLALLERVGLAHRARVFPGTLSGGERQRAAVARSVINDPVVIFADEPTGNLDSASGRAVLDLLDEHTAGDRALITVTHDPEVAARAQRRIFLQDGAIVS